MSDLPKKVFIWAHDYLIFGKKTTARRSMLHRKDKSTYEQHMAPQVPIQRLSCRVISTNFWLNHWDPECSLKVKQKTKLRR